ncbi:MAG: lysylphosphatidylglycerol synthase transmembrane domain-containing protein [Clostridia bacterium]|nr:flippase-like domain-containing protein [Clostridia bacterium]MDH7574001.1 lysylphosphatidylglycerol synthase transmembrane domain-containing protein [Clostridia bacterium]
MVIAEAGSCLELASPARSPDNPYLPGHTIFTAFFGVRVVAGREAVSGTWRRGYWQWLLLALALSVGTLFLYSLRTAGSALAWFGRVSGTGMLAVLALVGCLWLLEAWRVQSLVRAAGGRVGVGQVLQANLAAAFVAAVTPAAGGGPPAHVYFLTRVGLGPERAAAVVTARLLLNLVFFAFMGPPLFLLYRHTLRLPAPLELVILGAALGLAGLITGLLYLLFRSGLAERVLGYVARIAARLHRQWSEEDILNALSTRLDEFRSSLAAVAAASWYLRLLLLFLTTGYWIGFFSIIPLLSYTLGLRLDLPSVAARQFLYFFIVSYVPLPGASGAAELSLAALLSGLVPQSLLPGLVATWRFFTYHLNLLVGGAMVWWLSRRPERGFTPRRWREEPGKT